MAASTSSAAPARSALAVPIAVGCCAAGAVVHVAALDPESSGTYPMCAFRSVTGWWCPGCGLTRAVHRLLRGEITQALRYNALVVPVTVLLLIAWVAWLRECGGRRPAWVHRAAVPAWLGLAIVAVAFAILRNLPPFGALRG